MKNRTALVTGSASGVGEAIARRLARDGVSVVLIDISSKVTNTAKVIAEESGSQTLAFIADACDSKAMCEVVNSVQAALGPIDILVNNAWGGTATGAAIDITEEEWNQTLRGTLTSAFVSTQSVLPRMVTEGRGVIVNISSISAERFCGHDAYAVAKGGMMSLTRNLAARHGRDGIRVNAILAGTIVTANWNERAAARPTIFDELVPYYPLGRLGTPEDISSAVAFLISDEASWITGAALPVDGGQLVWNGDLAQVAELKKDNGGTNG